MPRFGGAGFSYEGLIKKRANDIVCAGWIYGKTSVYIPNASAAKLFEANYQWVGKALHHRRPKYTIHLEYNWYEWIGSIRFRPASKSNFLGRRTGI